MRLRVTVTVQAGRHAERLHLRDNVHLVDSAVAGHAGHAARDVRGVVEVHKVRQVVHAVPANRLVLRPAAVNFGQLRTGGVDRC